MTDSEDILPPDEQRTKTSAEEEIDAGIKRSKVKDHKKKRLITRLKIAGAVSTVLLLGYIFYLFFIAPFVGTMAYGICRVFLELNAQYPHTLRISTVEEFGVSVRIWFTQVDSFGQYRMEQMQCDFKADENLGFVLDKVTIDHREYDPAVIAKFNTSLPVVFEYPPDLNLPEPLPDSLESLQFEFEKFRKPIL